MVAATAAAAAFTASASEDPSSTKPLGRFPL